MKNPISLDGLVAPTHTPGPWEVLDGRAFGFPPSITAGEGIQITVVKGNEFGHQFAPDVNLANAYMAAAAPALYEAIKLRHAYEAVPTDRGGSKGPKGQARKKWLDAEAAALAAAQEPQP